MSVSKDEFRRALGHFASGVTVVTSRCEDGIQRGITVSAFSSLSLDPPLILICIDKKASLHDHLKEGRHFVVNILAEDQELVSRRFASKDADRFEGLGYREGDTGAALINGVLAAIERSHHSSRRSYCDARKRRPPAGILPRRLRPVRLRCGASYRLAPHAAVLCYKSTVSSFQRQSLV